MQPFIAACTQFAVSPNDVVANVEKAISEP